MVQACSGSFHRWDMRGGSFLQMTVWLSVMAFCLISCSASSQVSLTSLDETRDNAASAAEAFSRCHRFVEGWLTVADPATGLIPRNNKGGSFAESMQGDSYWNAKDAAADNYPFMVITAYLTDPDLLEGRMKEMLSTETRLTSCLGACPATYDFRTQQLRNHPVDTGTVIFGSAEYVKDGLLPITELMGPSPWSDRMVSILDDLHKLVSVALPGKNLNGAEAIEVNGDLLQALSRVYWFTGDESYLDWALQIGDYYLQGEIQPADYDSIQLRDHGCEFILGLCELYATLSVVRPEKREQYKAPLHRLLDRILETGRNEDGLFYNRINPSSGTILDRGIADTWGYSLDGYYTVYLLDGMESYRDAVVKVLGNLGKYRNHLWQSKGPSDGYADAIESALNLYNRERSASTAAWLDSEIRVMYSFQRENGIIEGWHGDGNFARTALMYALWKTRGTHISPWREDVLFGAVEKGDGILLTLTAGNAWEGKLYFDIPRHRDYLHLPFDWPRINQFPEWFTVERDRTYIVKIDGKKTRYSGADLSQGLSLSVKAGQTVVMEILGK